MIDLYVQYGKYKKYDWKTGQINKKTVSLESYREVSLFQSTKIFKLYFLNAFIFASQHVASQYAC